MPEGSNNNARDLFFKLVRYGFVGGASVLMYLGLYELIRHFTPLSVIASVIAAYVPTLLATFLAQSVFTFKSTQYDPTTIFKYLLSMGTGLLVVVSTVWLVHGVLGYGEFTANIVACLASPLVSFFLQNFWVFSKTSKE